MRNYSTSSVRSVESSPLKQGTLRRVSTGKSGTGTAGNNKPRSEHPSPEPVPIFLRAGRRVLNRTSGFTLLELMLVVLIIGLLAAIVAPTLVNRSKEAKVKTVQAQIANFETALNLYKMDNDNYPSTEQGLAALRQQPSGDPPANNWKGPYLAKALPKDPWGFDYSYVCPGTVNTDSFDIISGGPDGKTGTDDDITNYETTANK